MRLAFWFVAGVVALIVGSFLAAGPATFVLRSNQDLPTPVLDEIDHVVDRFRTELPGRQRCVPPAAVELVAGLPEGDARYLVAERTIQIVIPTSPRRFRDSLAHELAHHVELTCDEFESLQACLGSAGQDVSPPSEYVAEVVVQALLGERVRTKRSLDLDPGVVEMALAWGAGSGPDRPC